MKQKWLVLFLLLGAALGVLAGCTTRTTVTVAPTGEEASGPPVPTKAPQNPTAPQANTVPPADTTPSQPVTAGPTETPPPLPPAMAGPVFTVQGTLENGISWGTTADGNYFKGDPKAPLVMFEFSDFQ